ncbi:MAG TPA: HAD family hydrolase [Urbifossiella sp.]|jgi:phosphoserine phosphatase|nr:HAD family hydrolase [Urbifossiella sp.]
MWHAPAAGLGGAVIALAVLLPQPPARAQPAAPALASWNDTAPKKAITAFVARVTREGSPDFVPPAERVAVFDNDGTLWCEQPVYAQVAFAFDRVKALAPQHPEWQDKQPFQAVLDGDLKALTAAGEKGLAEVIVATHTGMTVDEFDAAVKDWLRTARHPKFNRPYTECVYQPMLELLAYLRANGFRTYIVTGGTADFVRAFAEPVYGVPPEHVIGTTFKTRYEFRDGKPALVILPQVDLIDDKAGKPVGIGRAIGRRPVIAVGNSDGDFEMLEWATSAPGPRLGLLVHHTDADREYGYDRTSRVGRLSRGLDAAPDRGWLVAGVKDDWKTVFPARKAE